MQRSIPKSLNRQHVLIDGYGRAQDFPRSLVDAVRWYLDTSPALYIPLDQARETVPDVLPKLDARDRRFATPPDDTPMPDEPPEPWRTGQGQRIGFVQKVNANQLGNLTDLGSFLFGRERGVLEACRPILRDTQAGRCFDCHENLKRWMEVDHFVPWSRYPTDLGHNFILADPTRNNAKSDHIAAEEHLGASIEQNREHTTEIAGRPAEAVLPRDLAASVKIAGRAYEQTVRANRQVWVAQ